MYADQRKTLGFCHSTKVKRTSKRVVTNAMPAMPSTLYVNFVMPGTRLSLGFEAEVLRARLPPSFRSGIE